MADFDEFPLQVACDFLEANGFGESADVFRRLARAEAWRAKVIAPLDRSDVASNGFRFLTGGLSFRPVSLDLMIDEVRGILARLHMIPEVPADIVEGSPMAVADDNPIYLGVGALPEYERADFTPLFFAPSDADLDPNWPGRDYLMQTFGYTSEEAERVIREGRHLPRTEATPSCDPCPAAGIAGSLNLPPTAFHPNCRCKPFEPGATEGDHE